MVHIKDAVEDYALDKSHLSRETRDWYDQKLAVFTDWLAGQGITDMNAITANDLRRFAAHVRTLINPITEQPVSTYTAHGYAQVVKQWLRWCGREGYCAETLFSKVTLPRVEQKTIHTLSRQQVEALFEATRREPTPQLVARDRALLAVMLSAGLRAGEVVGLALQNVKLEDLSDPHLALQKTKGSKWREVGLAELAVRYLRRYLRLRTAKPGVDAVFTSQRGDSLTVSGVDQILYRLRDWADGTDWTGVRVSAHTLRHTFAATYMKQDGADAFKLQQLLGHASIQTTTSVYLRDFRQRDARRGVNPLDTLLGGK